MHKPTSGFTIVELMVIISVLAVLAGIGWVGYGTWQRNAANSTVKSDVRHAASGLKTYQNFKNDYPPNLAGTNFAATDNVGLTLYTNAPQLRTYDNLTPSQNAQLFLNACNANMPTTSADGSVIYNTACTFAGNNVHVNGTVGSNIVIQGPNVSQGDIALNCGSECDAAVAAMISDFLAQNGTFPLDVPKSQVALPEPTLTTYGSATKFCIEGRAANHSDVVYHMTNTNESVQTGACPDDPELHYP